MNLKKKYTTQLSKKLFSESLSIKIFLLSSNKLEDQKLEGVPIFSNEFSIKFPEIEFIWAKSNFILLLLLLFCFVLGEELCSSAFSSIFSSPFLGPYLFRISKFPLKKLKKKIKLINFIQRELTVIIFIHHTRRIIIIFILIQII